MTRIIATGVIAAGVYALAGMIAVLGSHASGGTQWVPVVVYVGPAAYFITVVVLSRWRLQRIQSPLLRWLALLGVCTAMTAISTFLVFVLAVNIHLYLGGRL